MGSGLGPLGSGLGPGLGLALGLGVALGIGLVHATVSRTSSCPGHIMIVLESETAAMEWRAWLELGLGVKG